MLWINSFFDSWSFIAGSPTDLNLFSSVGEISFLIKEYCSFKYSFKKSRIFVFKNFRESFLIFPYLVISLHQHKDHWCL